MKRVWLMLAIALLIEGTACSFGQVWIYGRGGSRMTRYQYQQYLWRQQQAARQQQELLRRQQLLQQQAMARTNQQARVVTNIPPQRVFRYIPPAPKRIDPDAKKAEEQRLAQNAVNWLRQRAEAGSPSAQYSLGIRYLEGKGVEKDEVLGRQFIRRAADAGDSMARRKWGQLEAIDQNPGGRAEGSNREIR